jgi:hypothetical protein
MEAATPRKDGRDVDIDDVTVLEDLLPRDAVTDHLVDAGADALGEASVVQRSRCCVVLDGEVVNQRVQLIS